MLMCVLFCFFFKQKTAYEMLISYWSSDVCSSDLRLCRLGGHDDFPDRSDRGLHLRLEKRSAGMGVILPQSHAPQNQTVAPPPGSAPDADYFKALQSEVTDKGFLVTSTEDLFNWASTGSHWWMIFGLACCADEMIHEISREHV